MSKQSERGNLCFFRGLLKKLRFACFATLALFVRNDDRGMFCHAHNDEKCCHIEVSQETEISLFDSTWDTSLRLRRQIVVVFVCSCWLCLRSRGGIYPPPNPLRKGGGLFVVLVPCKIRSYSKQRATKCEWLLVLVPCKIRSYSKLYNYTKEYEPVLVPCKIRSYSKDAHCYM